MTHKLGYFLKCFRTRSGSLILLVLISSFTLVFPSIRLRAQSAAAFATVPITGPLTVSTNPHYFKDGNGTALILNGSQTWNTFQDYGTDGSLQPLDFNAFVKFLSQHGNNFTLLWTVEMPKFCNLPVTASAPPEFTVSPIQWERTGPGTATDGGLKFDLRSLTKAFSTACGSGPRLLMTLVFTRVSIYLPASISTNTAAPLTVTR